VRGMVVLAEGALPPPHDRKPGRRLCAGGPVLGYGDATRIAGKRLSALAATEGMAVSTLRDYVEVLSGGSGSCLPLILVPAAAVLFALRQPELHQASAQVLISRGGRP
jgi:hypothetical protein